MSEEKKVPAHIPDVLKTRFDYNAPIIYDQADLSFWSDGRRYDVGGRGMIGGFIGPEKAGKSFALGQVAASHVSGGREFLNFEIKTPGSMVWFDTEQSQLFYQLNQKRIHDAAGSKGNVPRYYAYNLRRWTPSERMDAIEHIIFSDPSLTLAVIDGLVDIVADYNDLKECQAAIGKIMAWSFERNIMVIGVLHVNKGDGRIRGHIGSEFKNKCDFIVKVEQPERNVYNLSNPTGRYPTFPAMDFTRNEETGLAEYTSGKDKLNLDF